MTGMKTHPELTVKPVIAQAPAAQLDNVVVTSAAIDTLGFDGFILTGLMGVTDCGTDWSLTESDTSGGSYTAVLNEDSTPVLAELTRTATQDGTLVTGFFRTDRRKRFIKVVNTTVLEGVTGFFASVIHLIGARDSGYQDVTYGIKL